MGKVVLCLIAVLNLFISLALIFLGVIGFFYLPEKKNEELACVMEHYPDKFIEVEMIGDDGLNDITVFDKGKAIYERYYIYNNVKYREKINSSEFDDKFYICEDNPSIVYSEEDIDDLIDDNYAIIYNTVGRIMGIVFIIAGISYLIFSEGVCLFFFFKKSKNKKIENQI